MFACREMIGGAAGCRHRRSFPQMVGIIRELSWTAELSARPRSKMSVDRSRGDQAASG